MSAEFFATCVTLGAIVSAEPLTDGFTRRLRRCLMILFLDEPRRVRPACDRPRGSRTDDR